MRRFWLILLLAVAFQLYAVDLECLVGGSDCPCNVTALHLDDCAAPAHLQAAVQCPEPVRLLLAILRAEPEPVVHCTPEPRPPESRPPDPHARLRAPPSDLA